MKIVHVIPGSGGTFYCENCLRDGSLVAALREKGHTVIVAPMYLPVFTDRAEVPANGPIFYGAVSTYLKETLPFLRRMPARIEALLNAPGVLEYAAHKAGSTRARGLERMTLSVLRGEDGHQASELDRMVRWLAAEDRKPAVVHLSNALLVGLARRIKQTLGVPVVCSLQDEDGWIHAMEPAQRDRIWETMASRAADVDAFTAVSRYYADRMTQRLALPPDKVHVVPIGIRPAEYPRARLDFDPPVLGFLSRLSPGLGLDTLAAAFLALKKEPKLSSMRLALMGGTLGADARFLQNLLAAFQAAGVSRDVTVFPEFDRAHRIEFLESLSVLSVPVPGGEAFGMYLIEAMACGVPVVQPRLGAFPEIVEAVGAGVLYEPNDPPTLAAALRPLLTDPDAARRLGSRGPAGVAARFDVARVAQTMMGVYEKVAARPPRPEKTP